MEHQRQPPASSAPIKVTHKSEIITKFVDHVKNKKPGDRKRKVSDFEKGRGRKTQEEGKGESGEENPQKEKRQKQIFPVIFRL